MWSKALMPLCAELTRGGFSKCRFARDGGLDFFTAVNAGGVGSVLHWRQNELGELVLSGRAKVRHSEGCTVNSSTNEHASSRVCSP